MGSAKYNGFKVMLHLIKYAMWPLGIWFGIDSLTRMTCGAPGFKFFGVLTLLSGLTLLILFCIDCCTFDGDEGGEVIFLCESLCCGLPLYLLMAALGFFALAVSIHGTEKSMPEGVAYKEYELGSYSKWLQNKVNDTHRWERYYKPRLMKSHVCSDMTNKFRLDTLDKFHQRKLNAFESGCCKPPEECKMNYTSPTVWTKAENRNYSNVDCYTWNNDPNTFCFNCQSCKAAFAQDVKGRWIVPGYIIAAVVTKAVIGFIIVALCCCCNPDMPDR